MLPGHARGALRRTLFSQAALTSKNAQGKRPAHERLTGALPAWADAVRRSCEERLAALKRRDSATVTLEEAVAAYDKCSLEACAVFDTITCIESLYDKQPRPEAVKAIANEASFSLFQTIQRINVDRDLYKVVETAYKQYVASNKPAGDVEDELERVARRILEEFRWDGACFDTERRSHISRLQENVKRLESDAQNLAAVMEQGRKPLRLPNSAIIPNDHVTFMKIAGQPISVDMLNQLFVSHHTIDNEGLRMMARVREELRHARHETAISLGYESFAHLTATKNMIKTPQVGERFLVDFLNEINPVVSPLLKGKHYSELSRVSMDLERSAFSQASNRTASKVFTLRNCLFGIRQFLKQTLGLTVVEKPLTKDEKWSDDPLCTRWIIYDGSEKVGDLYFDLFDRSGKSGSAWHMQIGTRYKDGSPHLLENTNSFATSLISARYGRHFEWDTSIGFAGFRELMHEMGHAMHALLSRTRFQHLSGSRCEVDFMETPSLLFERLAWDEDVIRLCDPKQYMTESELAGIANLRGGLLKAVDIQHQAVLALFDLREHMMDPAAASENEVFWETQREFSQVILPPRTSDLHPHLYFHHTLAVYASSFYTYIWSQAIASKIYEELFGKGKDLKYGGTKIKKELLMAGGSRDPPSVMKSLVGSSEGVCPSALVRSLIRN